MDNDKKPIRCPGCKARAFWLAQDIWCFGTATFTKRFLKCEESCGWCGPVAFFPWSGWEQHGGRGGNSEGLVSLWNYDGQERIYGHDPVSAGSQKS